MLAADQVRASLADGGVFGAAEVAELAVGVGRRLLDHRQCDHQLGKVRQRYAGKVKVAHRAQRLDTVVGVGGYFEGAKQVFFEAERCSGGHEGSHPREKRHLPRRPLR